MKSHLVYGGCVQVQVFADDTTWENADMAPALLCTVPDFLGNFPLTS